MRFEVSIPDPLFDGIQQAALASGQSMEAFMTDALRIHLESDTESTAFFTAERIAEIRAAQAESERGESMSLEQFKSERKQWREEWRANHPG